MDARKELTNNEVTKEWGKISILITTGRQIMSDDAARLLEYHTTWKRFGKKGMFKRIGEGQRWTKKLEEVSVPVVKAPVDWVQVRLEI